MAKATEAVYRGTVTVTGENGFCTSFHKRLGLKPGAYPFEVRYWRSGDLRQEMLTVTARGYASTRWVPTENSVTVIADDGKELHILERGAASGAPDSGFYLPARISSLFLVKDSPVENSWGDLCAKRSADCTRSTLGVQTGMTPIAITERGNRATVPGPDGPRYEAKLSGEEQGFPTLIQVVDSPGGGSKVATSAEFRLISVSPSSRQTVHPKDFVQKGATMNITRGDRTIGGAYSPGIQDPWKLFDAQVGFHRRLESTTQKQTSSEFVVIGAGLLFTALFLGLVARLIRKPGIGS